MAEDHSINIYNHTAAAERFWFHMRCLLESGQTFDTTLILGVQFLSRFTPSE